MLRVPLSIVSDAGVLQTGKASQATIYLSVDGATFTATELTITEIGSGYYYVDIPDTDLVCSYNVLIRCSCAGCQDTTFEYTPDSGSSGGGLTAADVWNYGNTTGIPLTGRTITGPVSVESSSIASIREGLSTFNALSDVIYVNAAQAAAFSAVTPAVDITTLSADVAAIKARTDNFPLDITSLLSGLSTFDPETDTVILGSLTVGTDTLASSDDIGALSTGISALTNTIDTLPGVIWGRESGDSSSRTLTSVSNLGLASEDLVRTAIGDNTSTGSALDVNDVDGAVSVSLTVTRDSNNKIINIK